MHVLVVNFNLKGITEEDYLGLVEPIAPAFAGLPGLISKTWLANAETNTYGGVYVWSDHGAMEAYKSTDIYKGMQANPYFDNVTVTDFAVVENATRVTRGPIETADSAVRQIARADTDSDHSNSRKGESGVRLRMVAAPGGVAFVDHGPALEGDRETYQSNGTENRRERRDGLVRGIT